MNGIVMLLESIVPLATFVVSPPGQAQFHADPQEIVITDSNTAGKLDAFDWNHWMTSIGISGCFAPEYAMCLGRSKTQNRGEGDP